MEESPFWETVILAVTPQRHISVHSWVCVIGPSSYSTHRCEHPTTSFCLPNGNLYYFTINYFIINSFFIFPFYYNQGTIAVD